MPLWKAVLTAALLALPLLGGCSEKKDSKLLGIEGYNYTDRYIDSFSVGGQGGGNVFLSTATSGGGGTSCCIGFSRTTRLPLTMKVKWTWGAVEDENYQVIKPQETAEVTAELHGPAPENPRFLEVHFMPDKTVRLLITAERSAPMVIIDRSKKAP